MMVFELCIMNKGFFRSMAIIYALAVLAGIFYMWNFSQTNSPDGTNRNTLPRINNNAVVESILNENSNNQTTLSVLQWPLSEGDKRTKLITFGLYITPQTSPLVHPEKWVGYHTALDFEIFPGEEEKDVPVSAVCEGNIVHAGNVSGYGGTIIQSCTLQGQEVTVLYGHLSMDSFQMSKGDHILSGQKLALLGKAYSTENGGVRKHLHIGIHKGTTIEYRGYVQNQTELQNFIDPLPLLK
jgi:murein DD-endopeptidase MepM/ murein hydrolase activator NlpD